MQADLNREASQKISKACCAYDPLCDGISSVELVRISGSDLDIANAARVSYGRISQELNERDEKLINFLMEHNHLSPFEHNQLSYRIKAPIFVARQWMRHRINSYNEISYRYVKVKTEFYIPKKWRLQDTKNKQSSYGSLSDDGITKMYRKTIEDAWSVYNDLLEAGVCREQARAVLPVATYTEFIYTCNLRSLTHFLTLRLESGAQKEIRAYAQALLRSAYPHFPVSLNAWKRIYMSEAACDDQIKKWIEQLGD